MLKRSEIQDTVQHYYNLDKVDADVAVEALMDGRQYQTQTELRLHLETLDEPWETHELQNFLDFGVT